MLTVEKKAGTKEFFLVILVLFVLSTFGSYISYILPSYKILGHLIGIALTGIYGVNVIKNYCSVFSYLEREDYFLIRRELGSKIKEEKIRFSDILLLSKEKSDKKIESYCVRILPHKSDLYIVLKSDREKALRISDDDGEILRLLNAKLKG